MMKTLTHALPLSLALGATACAGLDTGNGDVGTIDIALDLAPGQPVDSTGTTFTLTSAVATIESIVLKLPDGTSCDGVDGATCKDGKVTIEGPFSVDLLTGVSTPPIGAIVAPVGHYKRIDITFAEHADGITFSAAGTVPVGGDVVPFELALSFHETARFDGDVEVLEDTVATTFGELDPKRWFASVPLSECASEGDLPVRSGILVIEDGAKGCGDVEKAIKDAIKASGSLKLKSPKVAANPARPH